MKAREAIRHLQRSPDWEFIGIDTGGHHVFREVNGLTQIPLPNKTEHLRGWLASVVKKAIRGKRTSRQMWRTPELMHPNGQQPTPRRTAVVELKPSTESLANPDPVPDSQPPPSTEPLAPERPTVIQENSFYIDVALEQLIRSATQEHEELVKLPQRVIKYAQLHDALKLLGHDLPPLPFRTTVEPIASQEKPQRRQRQPRLPAELLPAQPTREMELLLLRTLESAPSRKVWMADLKKKLSYDRQKIAVCHATLGAMQQRGLVEEKIVTRGAQKGGRPTLEIRLKAPV